MSAPAFVLPNVQLTFHCHYHQCVQLLLLLLSLSIPFFSLYNLELTGKMSATERSILTDWEEKGTVYSDCHSVPCYYRWNYLKSSVSFIVMLPLLSLALLGCIFVIILISPFALVPMCTLVWGIVKCTPLCGRASGPRLPESSLVVFSTAGL